MSQEPSRADVSDAGPAAPVADGNDRGTVPRAKVGASVAEARRGAFGQMASVVIAIAAISAYIELGPRREVRQASVAEPSPLPPALSSLEEPLEPPDEAEEAESPQKPRAPAVAPPELDKAAIAEAEGALDAASRDRARADERAAESARRLALASAQAALDASRARKLAFLVRDPSTRITQATSRGGFLRGEREKLEKEVTTLRQLPRPKSTSILSKSPVAKPAAGSESHFELRRNRISFIDLERLLELTKAGRSRSSTSCSSRCPAAWMSFWNARACVITSGPGRSFPNLSRGAKPTRRRGTRFPNSPGPSIASIPPGPRSPCGSIPTVSPFTAGCATSWPSGDSAWRLVHCQRE